MVGKLALNLTQFTTGLVKYVPGRGFFRAVSFQNGDKFATSPTPPIVERLSLTVLIFHAISGERGNCLKYHNTRHEQWLGHYFSNSFLPCDIQTIQSKYVLLQQYYSIEALQFCIADVVKAQHLGRPDYSKQAYNQKQ